MRSLRSASIGSISAWLPSRRSVDSQIGGRVSVREGHWRPARSMGGNGSVLLRGVGLHAVLGSRTEAETDRRPLVRTARVLLELGGCVLCAREAQQKQQAQDEREERTKESSGRQGREVKKLLIGRT